MNFKKLVFKSKVSFKSTHTGQKKVVGTSLEITLPITNLNIKFEEKSRGSEKLVSSIYSRKELVDYNSYVVID